MAIIVEFTIPADAFPFGRAVSGDSDGRVWIERLVPLTGSRIPFLWARDHEFEEFERHLRDSDIVKNLEALTRVENSVLYAVTWYEPGETVLNGVMDSGGSIMEGHGDSTWSFTVRFNNHADLSQFHQFYQDEEYPVHIEQVTTLEDEPGQHYGWALTPSQREAVYLALKRGYYSVPRDAKLEEIAEDLDITRQAASERIRRGTETLLEKSLAGFSAADFEAAAEEDERV